MVSPIPLPQTYTILLRIKPREIGTDGILQPDIFSLNRWFSKFVPRMNHHVISRLQE